MPTASELFQQIVDRVQELLGRLGTIDRSMAWTPEDFGAVGDGVTDDAVALQLWLDAGGKLYLPANAYRSSARLVVRKCVRLTGASYGFDNRLAATPGLMPGSRIVFDAGVAGLDVQPQAVLTDPDAVAAAGAEAFVQEGAYNSRFEDIALLGSGGADATGFYSRTLVHAKNVHVEGFSGKGFDVSAALTADPTAEYGNASTSTLTACVAVDNGSHGFHLRGKDANACSLIGCNAISNGGWGILDESLLGNAYDGCHVANNTLGSVKNVGGVSNSSYIGLYIEPDVHQASDISYRCVVHGGQGADLVRQYNIGTNGHPTITTGIATAGLLTFHPGDYSGSAGAAIADTAVIYRQAARGLTLQGAGGTYDLTGVNSANTAVWGIVAGTTVTRFLGSVQILNNNVYFNDVSGFPGPFGGPGNGAAYATTVTGLTLTGRGSTYDVGLLNQAGAVALGVVAGTMNIAVAGDLSAASFSGAGVATAAEYRVGAASNKALTPDAVWDAAAFVALDNAGADVAVDLSSGINFTLLMDGDYTLSNPTNGKPGQTGLIEITQDGTGNQTLAFAANWKFAGGTDPVLSTAAGAKDLLFYEVLANGTDVYGNLVKAVA